MRRWSRPRSTRVGVGVRYGCGEGAFVGVGDGIVDVAAGRDEGGVEETREVAFEEGFGGGDGCADLFVLLVAGLETGRGRNVLRFQRRARYSWSPIHSKYSTSRPDRRCQCRCSRFGPRRRRRLAGRRRRGERR
jgi:hypothetical protein